VLHATLYSRYLLVGKMYTAGVEPTRGNPGMYRDLLEPPIEHPNQTGVPADPYFPAQVLWRDRVIAFGHFHVAVTMYLALALIVKGKGLQG
jgi:hypothetical protein